MNKAPIVIGNPKLLELCITSVKEKLKDARCSIVKPADTLRRRSINDRPISAANLLMYDMSVVSKKPLPEYHFHQVPLTGVVRVNELSDFIDMVDHFLQRLSTSLSQRCSCSDLVPAILKCEADVFQQLCCLGSRGQDSRGIFTPAAQTDAITGPILTLLCTFCYLKVCVISVNTYFCCSL